MYEDLNAKQAEILNFIKDEVNQKGYPPSVREICRAVKLSSTSSVHAHLEKLQKKGYIKKDPSKPRAIEILYGDYTNSSRKAVQVPIIGKVTAGQPILAVQNFDGMFPLPKNFVADNDVFMLKVYGESMIDAGIYDGDYVIVRQQTTAENGDIIVALIDEESATVKRFFKEKDHIRLQPENPAMDPIIVKNVIVLGKVIGLFRKM